MKKIKNKILKLYDKSCMKISGVVGIGIHLYSTIINTGHFQGIYDDFINERYVVGTLKTIIPYVLPYSVSFYARKKAKKEVQEKIGELEKTILNLKNK